MDMTYSIFALELGADPVLSCRVDWILPIQLDHVTSHRVNRH